MKSIRPRLVAAVRWDYEIGLMSRADLVRKYHMVLGLTSVYAICNGTLQPGVASARHALAWCKRSWRQAA